MDESWVQPGVCSGQSPPWLRTPSSSPCLMKEAGRHFGVVPDLTDLCHILPSGQPCIFSGKSCSSGGGARPVCAPNNSGVGPQGQKKPPPECPFPELSEGTQLRPLEKSCWLSVRTSYVLIYLSVRHSWHRSRRWHLWSNKPESTNAERGRGRGLRQRTPL